MIRALRYSAKVLLPIALLSLILAEALVRIFLPQQEPMLWLAPSEQYGHQGKKNFFQRYHYVDSDLTIDVQTNSLGFRDDEFEGDGPRILLLGDSFVFGYGVKQADRFDTLLEEKLQSKVQIFNAGMGGWGTLQETAFMRDHLTTLNPDVVVLTFCGNDPLEDEQFEMDSLTYREGGLVEFPGKAFIRAHSHLYRFAAFKTHLYRHKRYLSKRSGEAEPVILDEQSASVLSESDWEKTLGIIRRAHRDFLAHNPKGIFLVQATAPEAPDIRKHLQSLTNDKDFFYVDMAKDFAPLTREQKWCLPTDQHWSPLLHSISATHLHKALTPYLAALR